MRTNEELNRIIAEWCGWIYVDGWHHMLHPNPNDEPPNYCTDLNAIHEAENKWCDTDLAYNKYSDTLFSAHWENQIKLKKPWRWITATARERSEALVKMIEGKEE